MNDRLTPKDSETLFPVVYPKAKGNYSLRADVKHDFDELSKQKSYNKSGVIEKLLIEFLADHGLEKYKREIENR